MGEIVIDASALVDLLLGNETGRAVQDRVGGHAMHAPAHIDAETLSALGRLHRAGDLDAAIVDSRLQLLSVAQIQRHPVGGLLRGAWARRHRLRLVDAVYVELAASLDSPLVTTDRRLRDEPLADVVYP